jgi:hypothetical protein
MPIPPTDPQNHDAIIMVVLLVAGFFAFFTKVALRIIAGVLIGLVIYGLITSLHGAG